MKTFLIDIFEIADRGCVVLVEKRNLNTVIGDKILIGDKPYQIGGIEMVKYNREGLKRLAEGWKPPLGLLLKGANKADLADHVGEEVFIELGQRS